MIVLRVESVEGLLGVFKNLIIMVMVVTWFYCNFSSGLPKLMK